MSVMPTEGMREEAQRYRDWKSEGRDGGTEVAAQRATQILSGDELSDETIVTMAAWFARHEVDKQAEGFSPGEDGYPSPGRVAWAAWGGDPGQSWADSLVAKMDRAMPEETIAPAETTDASASVEDKRDYAGKYQRSEVTHFRAVEERVMEFPFSSEYPVERYFGKEVLSHDMDAAGLERLNDGAPLLFNHDPDRVLGVVERAWIDGDKKRGYAKVRFSRNKAAQEVLDDVRDGILRGVSFGYSIDEMQEREGSMVATRWQPYEISVVSIPADPSVGVGRSLMVHTLEEQTVAADAASPIMDAPAPEMDVIRSEAVKAERDRIAAITALGEKHKMADLARELIDGGKSLAEAREAVLDKLGQTAMTQPIRSEDITRNDIGLSKAETKRFSFVRALNYLANPGDASARRGAEFEIEVGRAAAAQYERSSNGIVVPNEVLRRDLVAEIPTAGGNLVPDELLTGSFIDLLRNRLALAQAGVTTLTGLQGNISIPRQTSAATAYWVGENVAPTESQQAIDQVNMTPKTVAAFVDYSRRLLLQSSIDVEGMIRNDLARVIALEIDRAAIYGTGSSNQPLGLTLTPGIGTETLTNAGTFTQLIAMETDVAVANADVGSLRYIMNATARGLLKSTSKAGTEAVFVWENNEVNGYPVIVSNQLQGNDALFGDFSQMVMGMWSGLDLMVDPYAGATDGTVRVIAHQDLDVAVKQPGAFCLGT
jgi:HK97 family phage major capsid protein/HK97 family phage prohead protease